MGRTAERLESSFGGAWSPDGRSIVFARGMPFGEIDLHVMNADGSGERVLLEREGTDGGARYSPDGSLVAFHASVGEESRIAVVGSDGSGLRFLTGGGLHYQPAWSPDGRWLLFTGAPLGAEVFGLFRVPVEGGDVVVVVDTDVDERTGSWPAEGVSGR